MKTANTLTIEAMMNEKPNIPKLPINTTKPVNEKNGESVQKQQCKKTTPLTLYILGKWKLEGTKLSNQAGIALTGNWVLPNVGTILRVRYACIAIILAISLSYITNRYLKK